MTRMWFTKRRMFRIGLIIAIGIAIIIFVINDYNLYSTPIGKISNIKETYQKTEQGYDNNYKYNEKYYTQKIAATIMNGSQKGQTIILENTYGESCVYDTKYSVGNDVFIENIKGISENQKYITGSISTTKRDYFLVVVLVLLFGLFLIIGGKHGALTIASLVINMVAFYYVLLLYTKGYNILVLTIPMTIFFTLMLLFFMYGLNEKTWIAAAATLATATFVWVIAAIVLHFSGQVDYDFMDYLTQPYEQNDANLIFLSEILVGSLGAIMDVVITIVMTVNQIVITAPDSSIKALKKSCRNVGDDLVGTMINVMFFTNIAAIIPFFILSMRNGIEFKTIIRYNVFFELARFLTGSIGVVLAIPISGFSAIYYYKKKVKKC